MPIISVASAGKPHNYWSWLNCVWAFLVQVMYAEKWPVLGMAFFDFKITSQYSPYKMIAALAFGSMNLKEE